MEGVVIVLACVIYSAFATTSFLPMEGTGKEAATILWNYISEILLNMLILCGTVKAADRVSREMMGLQKRLIVGKELLTKKSDVL